MHLHEPYAAFRPRVLPKNTAPASHDHPRVYALQACQLYRSMNRFFKVYTGAAIPFETVPVSSYSLTLLYLASTSRVVSGKLSTDRRSACVEWKSLLESSTNSLLRVRTARTPSLEMLCTPSTSSIMEQLSSPMNAISTTQSGLLLD